jgi:hypothetical protein
MVIQKYSKSAPSLTHAVRANGFSDLQNINCMVILKK